MATSVARSGQTYEDYAALPDDGCRYEILDGELFVAPAPSTKHQIVASNLAYLLTGHVKHRRLGLVMAAPTDVVLAYDTVVQPDLLYISRSRRGIVTRPNVQGPPDLVVEVISPSSTTYDQEKKRDIYAKYGVRYYWLVEPLAEWVRAYELAAHGQYALVAEAHGQAAFSAPPFPDLTIQLADLWDDGWGD